MTTAHHHTLRSRLIGIGLATLIGLTAAALFAFTLGGA